MARWEADFPQAQRDFEAEADVTEEMRDRAVHIAKLAQRLEHFRMAERASFGEHVELADPRYSNERLSLRTLTWICECQCNLLYFLLVKRDVDLRTSPEFVARFNVPRGEVPIGVWPGVSVLEYSMVQVRFAVLRIMKMWSTLPLLDPAFITYMKALRLRISMLQCVAWPADTDVLDYPMWRRALTTPGTKKDSGFARASTEFANTMEMYFYYLARQIQHEQDFFENSEEVPIEQLINVNSFVRWLEHYKHEVLVQQLRREVIAKCILNEVIPLECEVYKKEFPTGYSDSRTVLGAVRNEVRTQFDSLHNADLDQVMEIAPLMGTYFRFLFLIQSLVTNFDVRQYVFFTNDISPDIFGCAYPSRAHFQNLDFPVVYIPQTRRQFYVCAHHRLYRCKPDINVVLSVWLRAACGLWTNLDEEAVKHRNPYIDQRLRALHAALDKSPSPFEVEKSTGNQVLSALISALSADDDNIDMDEDDPAEMIMTC